MYKLGRITELVVVAFHSSLLLNGWLYFSIVAIS